MEQELKLLQILKKRKANFEKWNEELKGNYVGQIINLRRRINAVEDTIQLKHSKKGI